METAITIFLMLLALYVTIGVLFALYIVILGATKLDPLMKDTKKVVRVLLFPGIVATWPLLFNKLVKQKG